MIPSVTREEMIDIDRLMIEYYDIDLLIMMENAGKSLAIQAKRMLNNTENGRIAVLVGKGNNAGGGLVAARHLHNWGLNVLIILGEEGLRDIPRKQLEINRNIGIDITQNTDLNGFNLVIDALIGYNLKGDPREPISSLINSINAFKGQVLALDIPSGLDSSSGTPYKPCVKATVTLTLALPKTGLMTEVGREFVGDIYLADISIPREIYLKFNITKESIFKENFIIHLD
jgi:NAD(P)H-hydrate epimerase